MQKFDITIQSYTKMVFTRRVNARCRKHAENIAKKIAGSRNSILRITEIKAS